MLRDSTPSVQLNKIRSDKVDLGRQRAKSKNELVMPTNKRKIRPFSSKLMDRCKQGPLILVSNALAAKSKLRRLESKNSVAIGKLRISRSLKTTEKSRQQYRTFSLYLAILWIIMLNA